ncbi:MAG: hexameric tyrosine-coordinated heme protein [Chthoniobacterales bacterium]
MTRIPDSELVLVPGGSLITATAEEGRALAITMARHMIHNLQPDLDVLKAGRPTYAADPDSLIAASQVVAIEFQTIAAASNYWRPI